MQNSNNLPRAAHRGAVNPSLIRPSSRDLQIDRQFPTVVDDDGRHHRPLGAIAYQGSVGSNSVRSQSRRIPKGLNKISLAIAVGTDEHGASGFELQVNSFP